MIAVGILSFIVFLFNSYALSKDDFVFMRKNISLEQIFNTIFIGFFIVIATARIGYVAFHPFRMFLNPLVFFALPYFPGLSFLGGFVGACFFISVSYLNKKQPTERILDMFSISFLGSWACFSFFTGLFDVVIRSQHVFIDLLVFLLTFCVSVVFSLRFKLGKWPDGILFSLTLIVFSVLVASVYILASLFAHKFVLQGEPLVAALVGCVGIGFFLRKVLMRKHALKK